MSNNESLLHKIAWISSVTVPKIGEHKTSLPGLRNRNKKAVVCQENGRFFKEELRWFLNFFNPWSKWDRQVSIRWAGWMI